MITHLNVEIRTRSKTAAETAADALARAACDIANSYASTHISIADAPAQSKPAALLYIDQYGAPVWARTVRELREKAGGGRVSTMYRDKKDGRAMRVGYVVGQRWFTRFAPVELPA